MYSRRSTMGKPREGRTG